MNTGEHYKKRRSLKEKLKLCAVAVTMLGLPPVAPASYLANDYSPVPLLEQKEVTIITSNVHNRPLIRYLDDDFLQDDPLNILTTHQPDIACFQEISAQDAAELTQYGEVVYKENNNKPFNGSVGIAQVSTRRMSHIQTPNLSKDSERSAIVTTIDDIQAACTHLTDNPVKAKEQLHELLNRYPDLAIVAGDFNLEASIANTIMRNFRYASTDKPTLVHSNKSAVDRVFLKNGQKRTIQHWISHRFRLLSDHRGVKASFRPLNWANTSRQSLQ